MIWGASLPEDLTVCLALGRTLQQDISRITYVSFRTLQPCIITLLLLLLSLLFSFIIIIIIITIIIIIISLFVSLLIVIGIIGRICCFLIIHPLEYPATSCYFFQSLTKSTHLQLIADSLGNFFQRLSLSFFHLQCPIHIFFQGAHEIN